MHPAIMRQLADDHVREIHAKAEDERRACQARRRAPSTRLRLPAGGTVSYDDPRLDTGQRPTMTGQPSAPPVPVMADSPARLRRRRHPTRSAGPLPLIREAAGGSARADRPECADGRSRIRRRRPHSPRSVNSWPRSWESWPSDRKFRLPMYFGRARAELAGGHPRTADGIGHRADRSERLRLPAGERNGPDPAYDGSFRQ